MISKFLTAGTLAIAVASFAPSAIAAGVDKDGGFYATPLQHGAPRDLPGERLIPGANIAVDVIDGVARPLVVDPIQTAGASLADPLAAPAGAAAPKAVRHHSGHHRHASAKHHTSAKHLAAHKAHHSKKHK